MRGLDAWTPPVPTVMNTQIHIHGDHSLCSRCGTVKTSSWFHKLIFNTSCKYFKNLPVNSVKCNHTIYICKTYSIIKCWQIFWFSTNLTSSEGSSITSPSQFHTLLWDIRLRRRWAPSVFESPDSWVSSISSTRGRKVKAFTLNVWTKGRSNWKHKGMRFSKHHTLGNMPAIMGSFLYKYRYLDSGLGSLKDNIAVPGQSWVGCTGTSSGCNQHEDIPVSGWGPGSHHPGGQMEKPLLCSWHTYNWWCVPGLTWTCPSTCAISLPLQVEYLL